MHTNFISQIEDLSGNIYCDPADIDQAFLNFYQHLWNTPSNANMNIVDALPPDLPRLFDSDNLILIQEVTMEEVYLTLVDLPSSKFPGTDGFNVEFYQNFWHIVGDQLFVAIQ